MNGPRFALHLCRSTAVIRNRVPRRQFAMMVFVLFLPAPLVNAAEDDFNDNVVDPTKWNIVDSQFNAGRLAETNSRLEYLTVGIPTANDSSERIWVGGEVSYTNSWLASVDMHLSDLSLPDGAGCFVALSVEMVPRGLPDFLNIALSAYNDAGSIERKFDIEYFVNGTYQVQPFAFTSATNARLRLRYVASTNSIVAEFAIQGTNYVPLTTINAALWNMSDSSTLRVSLEAGSSDVAVNSGQAHFDNFSTSVSLKMSQPTLGGNMLTISWEGGIGPYQLQENSTLSAEAWQNLGSETLTNSATASVANGNRFYRVQDLGGR